MDTKSLILFAKVANSGSFAEVAREFDRDPSQVSRAIASLEQELQVQLIKRSTRKLSLTEAGERYYLRIQPLLEELTAANEEAKGSNQTPSGKVRITASTAFGQVCLLPTLNKFYQQYPGIELELALSDLNLDLIEDNLDLALRLSPEFQSNLIGRKLFATHYRVYAAKSYLEKLPSQQPLNKPEDLSQHHCVVINLPNYRTRWRYRQQDNDELKEIKIQHHLSLTNALALKQSLLQGLGPGLASDWLMQDEVDSGRVVDLFPDYQFTATDFNTAAWLLYPSRKYLPSKTQAVINFLVSELKVN